MQIIYSGDKISNHQRISSPESYKRVSHFCPYQDGENPISGSPSRAKQPTGQIILADRGQIFLFSFFCKYATSDFFQGQSISPRSIFEKIRALTLTRGTPSVRLFIPSA
jgi:hypothetical protein